MASRLYSIKRELFDYFTFADKADAENIYFSDPESVLRHLNRVIKAIEELKYTKRKRAPNIDEKKMEEVLSIFMENPNLTDAQLASSTGLSVGGIRKNETLRKALRLAKKRAKEENIGRNIVYYDEL